MTNSMVLHSRLALVFVAIVAVADRRSPRGNTEGGADASSIALVSNALDPPADEGTKKTAQELARVLAAWGAAVHAIPAHAPLAVRKLLLSPRLLRALRVRRPSAVVYIPTQSATLGSLVRTATLRLLAGTKVVMVALQPRNVEKLPRSARQLRPDLLLTPSPSLLERARGSGFRAEYLELGADLERFVPVPRDRKLALRAQYGLPSNQIVLHVGHARRGRRLEWIGDLNAGVTTVVVVGRSLGGDPAVVASIRAAGARVIDEFVPAIHELYQLADVYAFPVADEQAAIGAPLSVLEAMACNLPVVTTRFAALPQMFREGGGLFFADDETEFRRRVRAALRLVDDDVATRDQVLAYTWSATADRILGAAGGLT
jgi:glycosyltransferase involved in cell wall biosynthesis